MTKSRNILPPRHQWTWVELEMVRLNYEDARTSDLCQVLGLTPDQIHRKAHQLGLKKKRELVVLVARERSADPAHPMHKSGFKKGIVPWNTGMRRPGWSVGRMRETQFKKGTLPPTTMPIGSYRINGDGWAEYKFSDEPGSYIKRWIPVHRKVWIDANGPVPKGHIVVFKPGRKTTDPKLITLDAVELISYVENMRRNTIHQMPPQLADLSRLRGRITKAINRRTKEAEA